jgi:hypothetical protein
MRAAQIPLSVAALILFVFGCRRDEPTGPPLIHSSVEVSPLSIPGKDPRAPPTFNERLALQIPTFGGAFNDKGAIGIYLTDLGRETEARGVLQRELATMGGDQPPLRFLKGQYTYIELRSIHANIPNLGTGMSSFGVDTRRNRYLIEVISQEEIGPVREILRKAGVAMGAILIEVAPRGEPLTTRALNSQVPSIWGGIGISISGHFGTLTAVVWINGTEYFLVSRHVVDAQLMGSTGATVRQPNSLGQIIGTVVNNPGRFNCGQTWPCVQSDAALVSIGGGVAHNLGYIARPTSGIVTGNAGGSLLFDDNFPIILTGEQVFCWNGGGCLARITPDGTGSKVGQTTGWTGGDYFSEEQNIVGVDSVIRLYTVAIDGHVQGGDSGAPILDSDNQRILGVLWGRRTVNGVDQILYSPIGWASVDLAGDFYKMHASQPQMLGWEWRWIPNCEPNTDNHDFYLITGWPDGHGDYHAFQRDYMGTASYWCNGNYFIGYYQLSSEYAACNAWMPGCPCAYHISGATSCPTRPSLY